MHKENQTAKNKDLNFIPSDPTISARYAGTWKKPGRDLSVRPDQLHLYKMRDKNGKLTLRLPCTIKMGNLRFLFFSIKINHSLETFNSEKEI